MITPEYCATMARYNAWQNAQLIDVFGGMDAGDLIRDQGAFFGSILATANHLVWGDMIWMSRFDKGPAPSGGIADSVALYPGLEGWTTARTDLDARILDWGNGLEASDIEGDMNWFSGAMGREVTAPRALCVTHMFNHQTHHRGQIHAMLTAQGGAAPISDLFFMPQEAT